MSKNHVTVRRDFPKAESTPAGFEIAPAPSPYALAPLLLLLAGSGCAALIYEIVWFQLLQLVIGSSVVSLGLLLAFFMGGMCAGSAAFGWLVSPMLDPRRVYAALELGIGAFGIVGNSRGAGVSWLGLLYMEALRELFQKPALTF